jgi:hypothetical protein
MIMYIFTVLLMQGVIMHLSENLEVAGSDIGGELAQWYGSVAETLFTLLGSITGGVDWLSATDCLDRISPLYRMVFAIYVFFVVIGVLNVLTGIFVERATEVSGLDRDLVIQSELKRSETFVEEMTRIFHEADEDSSGRISWAKFRKYLENARVKAYLATQQLDAFDARTLFDILSHGSEGAEISIEQFIVGCMRLKGQARSVELIAVLQETRSITKKLRGLMRSFESAALTRSSSVAASSSFAGIGSPRASVSSHRNSVGYPLHGAARHAALSRSRTTPVQLA